MRHKKLKISAILLFGFGLTGVEAQESVNATGSNASGNGGSVSYSVGQGKTITLPEVRTLAMTPHPNHQKNEVLRMHPILSF